MATETQQLNAAELAELQLLLCLGTEGLELDLQAGSFPLDASPWTADVMVAQVSVLGHHDKVPRSYDWENLVAMLEPKEELLLFVDYNGTGPEEERRVQLHLAMRFAEGLPLSPSLIRDRRRRFEAVLSSFRRQVFPESVIEALTPTATAALFNRNLSANPTACKCIVGSPSPKNLADDKQFLDRDEDARSYQSLNDVVETCIELGQPYRMVFAVMRVTEEERAQEAHRVHAIWNAVHSLIEVTQSEQATEAINWSKAIAEAEQAGGNQQEQDIALGKMGRNVNRWINLGRWGLTNRVRKWTGKEQKALRRTALVTRTWSKSTTETESNGGSVSNTSGLTMKNLDSGMMLAEKSLQRYAKQLYGARGTGGYRSAVFIFAEAGDDEIIARATKAVLSGAQTCDRPFEAFPINGPASDLFRSRFRAMEVLEESAPILSLDQACQMLLLPEAELPGLQLRRSVFLGRNTRPQRSEDVVHLGPDAFWHGSRQKRTVQIEYSDLTRHTLVAGATGSGKTYRAVETLNGLDEREDLQIIVFETAKGVYRHRLRRANRPPPIVYTIGDGRASEGRFRPLHLNPFRCDLYEEVIGGEKKLRAALKRHIVILSDALSELMPTEALIGPKLREAVEACYRDLGWDIERGEWVGDGVARFPDGIDFVVGVRRIAAQLNYGPEVNANYRGALEGRAQLFLQDSYRDLFMPTAAQALDDLLPPGHDVIFESEALPAGEVNIPAFLLSILLSRLRERAQRARRAAGTGEIAERRLLVIEEAHNVLSREHEQKLNSGESQGERTLLKRLTKLLSEGRELGLGVMVVEQSPSLLARAVIANTGTKIIMRLEDGSEIEEMGQSLGLREEAWPDLGLLRRGEAIIKASYMTQPVKSSPYEQADLTDGVEEADKVESRGDAVSYTVLRELWRQVLDDGIQPSSRWRESLERASNGDARLAGAAASLSLIDAHRDPLLEDEAYRDGRDALRAANDFGGIVQVAEAAALRSQQRERGRAVWALLRRLCSVAWSGARHPPLGSLEAAGWIAEMLTGDPSGADALTDLLVLPPGNGRQGPLRQLGCDSDEELIAAVLALCPKRLVQELFFDSAHEALSAALLRARAMQIAEALALGLFDGAAGHTHTPKLSEVARLLARQAAVEPRAMGGRS